MKKLLAALAVFLFIGAPSVAQAHHAEPEGWQSKKIVENYKKAKGCDRELSLYGKSSLRMGHAYRSPSAAYKKWALDYWRTERERICSLEQKARKNARVAIRVSFGKGPGDKRFSHIGNATVQAIEVAWCESRLTLHDRLGQYLGLFQMGEWERKTYAYPYDDYSDYLEQAQAGARYFFRGSNTGHWGPWECKPDGSLYLG